MADEQDILLKQINEEVRREQLAKLWDKYGVIVLGVVATILLVFGGWRLYVGEMKRAAERAGGQFAEANRLLGDKKATEGLAALEAIAKGSASGYAQLAQLKLAAEAREKGRTQDAINHYSAVADNSSADPLLKSFAKLQIATLKLDTASFTDVKNQLNDLLNDSNPWRHSAREILGLAAYKAGNYAEARKTFQALMLARDVPRQLVQRAQVAMALITRDELQAKNGPAATPSPAPAKPPAKPNGAAAPGNAKTK
ncbi:MAG: tetratricopeptide repeat protein [Hyphomicrobiaceae bacterium]|nr:tetratricopeptide repeat protein [Hyphomicrobiaceae bacterium]